MENKKKSQLDELGVKFGTDKSSALHNYLVEYEKLFPEPEKIKKVVELGLQRRSGKWKYSFLPSVNMWLEFFTSAHVFGFDKQKLSCDSERVTLFYGDQGRIYHHMQFSESAGWDLDFVISDCSHRPTHDLLSLLFFFPRLKSGGVFIVEDVQAVVQKEYPEHFRTENYFEQYLKTMPIERYEWVESKSAGPKSSLIIIKK